VEEGKGMVGWKRGVGMEGGKGWKGGRGGRDGRVEEGVGMV
jgi:hypothetical protein